MLALAENLDGQGDCAFDVLYGADRLAAGALAHYQSGFSYARPEVVGNGYRAIGMSCKASSLF